jgi:hypothetical protein
LKEVNVSKLRTASWVLLAVVGVLVLLVSFLSAGLAYRGDYQIAGVSVGDVAAGREPVLIGLRGVRGTSAAWGAAWAALFLAVVIGPYRRGDVATWWGIMVSVILLAAITGARVLLLSGPQLGTGTPLVLLVVVLVALLLDVKRLSEPR